MSRKIKVQDIATTEPNRFIRTELWYDVGGLNYFSGGSKKRGYYASATPVKIEDGSVSFLAFSGTCQLVEEVTRFSQRRLEEHAATVRQRPIYQQLIDHVIAKGNITLAQTTPNVAAPALAA